MSRCQTSRPVLTPFLRQAIEMEVRRCAPNDLTLSTGANPATASPLVELAAHIEHLSGLAGTGASVELMDETRDRIDRLLAASDTLTAEAITVAVSNIAADVEVIENAVVDDVCTKRTAELAAEAAALALQRAGLRNVEVRSDASEIVVVGATITGQTAEFALDGEAVTLTVDDPADAVHAQHRDAGQLCVSTQQLTDEIHDVLPHALAEVGLGAGPVDQPFAATRGARARRIARPAPKRRVARRSVR